jgi:hypothetical protein
LKNGQPSTGASQTAIHTTNRAERAAAGVVSPYGMQGSRPGSALPCPAGRSVPGRGGPERRRRPRPDGTGRAAAPHSRLAHETVVTEDGPYPLHELGAVASTCEVVVLVGRATPRAISSGHERYRADSHGHSERADGLGSTALTWGGGGGRNCMACKGSSRGIEKTWVYGGLRVADGQAVTLTAPSRNSANYQRFLALVERTIPGQRDRGGDRQTCPAIPASPRASGWPSIHGSDRCLSPRARAG